MVILIKHLSGFAESAAESRQTHRSADCDLNPLLYKGLEIAGLIGELYGQLAKILPVGATHFLFGLHRQNGFL